MNGGMKTPPILLLFLAALGAAGCRTSPKPAEQEGQAGRLPFDYERFAGSPEYRFSRDIWKKDDRIAAAHGRNSEVVILRGVQRGRLYVNGEIAMDFPICSGRTGRTTPAGNFRITQKAKDYRSNLYGAVTDAAGKIVNRSATPASPVPAGGRYVPAEMPYWMRINGAIGLHVGNVYREENSHGCIRVPREACEILFDKLDVGSRVVVK